MYSPRQFRVEEREIAAEFLQQNPFGQLVTVTKNLPQISHVPFIFDLDGHDKGRAYCHIARANPQWRNLTTKNKALAIFQGPHAYISPRWYDAAPDNVPTWNYSVVHVHGSMRTVNDEDSAFRVMSRLTRSFDPQWPLELSSVDRTALLNAIVVLELKIEKIETKFKLSQNRSATERARIIEALADSSRESERLTAELMARFCNG